MSIFSDALTTSKSIIYPDFAPWSLDKGSNYMWITIQTLAPLTKQSVNVRNVAPDYAANGPLYTLLAPEELQFNLDHEWQQYEHMAARLAGVISQYAIAGSDLGQAFKTLGQTIGNFISGKSVNPEGAIQQGLFGANVYNYKVDAPLVYKGSNNLEYKFDFNFSCHSLDSAQKLYNLVSQLRVSSSPDKADNSILNITPPNIFEVNTLPAGLMHIKYAALTSMSTTLGGPFHHGKFPHRVHLELTFRDIAPLYKATFGIGGTSSGPEITAGVITSAPVVQQSKSDSVVTAGRG